MTLNETLDRAEAGNADLTGIVFSHPFQGEIVTHMTILLIGFIDIALEHHRAITLLIRQELNGSAMALVRSVYEVMYRGTWAAAHASDDDAEKMRHDTFNWPKMGVMVAASDQAYGISFFEAAKKGNWESLNSFTHSGSLQVARRFTENDLQPNYPQDELKHAATSTLIAAGILAMPFLRMHGRNSEAEQVEAFLSSFAADTAPPEP